MKEKNPFDRDPKALCKELADLNKWYPGLDSYAKISASPLGLMSTSTSALTITSILILLNTKLFIVKVLTGISLLLLIIMTISSLLLLFILFRANFRLTRVHFTLSYKKYLEKEVFNPVEIEDIIFQIKLAKKAIKTMHHFEWLYQHIFWRLFYVFVSILLVMLSGGILLEVVSRIGLI